MRRRDSISGAGRIALVLAAIICCLSVRAQDITPVDVDPTKPEQPRLHYYDKHGKKLSEPMLFLTEKDTVKAAGPASPWPVFNGVTLGLNFFDAALLAAGQGYASFDLSASVSIHNWFFPTLEAGVGFSDYKAAGSDLKIKTKPSPFIKIGLDYNFLYKSNPDYMLAVGVRFCYARPSYDISGASVSAGYWDETATISIPNQKTHSFYGEALAGIKVKIWENISMGWSARYNFNLKTPDASQSTPWFIPGFGAGSPLSFSFSIFYTFGHRKEIEE